MATIEKLFNFDDQLLTRELAGQREDTMFGNSMPKGYGAVGMGWNKMLRGLFNNNDSILKEKAIAEQALQMTQQQLGGDMSDPSKMYGVLIKNLTELGASPGSITRVAERKVKADATAATTSLAASNEAFKNYMTEREYERKLESDKNKLNKDVDANLIKIEKQLDDRIKLEPDFMKNQALSVLRPTEGYFFDFEGDTTGQALDILTRQFIRAKGPNGKPLFNGLTDALETAKSVLVRSGPETGFLWQSADKINEDALYAIAAQEIRTRGGVGSSAPTPTTQQDVPQGPEGTTFVGSLDDGKYAIFEYEDGRQVVIKGTE